MRYSFFVSLFDDMTKTIAAPSGSPQHKTVPRLMPGCSSCIASGHLPSRRATFLSPEKHQRTTATGIGRWMYDPRTKPLPIAIRLIPKLRCHVTLPPSDAMSPILFVRFPANIIPAIPYLTALPMSPFAASICVHNDLHLDPSN